MAAQALRRYVSTPLDNLGCLAISVHLQRWPRRYGGYVPTTSDAKDVTLHGGIACVDHGLVGFGALLFLAADRADTSRGDIPSLRICLGISTRQLDFFWTGAAALSSPSLSHDVGPRFWPQIVTASHGL